MRSDPEWDDDKGQYRIRIGWDRKLTSSLRKNPISYDSYMQHVRRAVTPANESTLSVFEAWLRKEGSELSKRALGVKFATSEVKRRLGQGPFRDKVLTAYGWTSAMSGCGRPEALEAAHIVPVVSARGTHQVHNSLLLRADIHNLFDYGLMSVSSNGAVTVAPENADSTYRTLHGRKLNLPIGTNRSLLFASLAQHRKQHFR